MTPEQVVAGLTKAQREVLLRMPGKVGRGKGKAGRSLYAKGLIDLSTRYAFQYVVTNIGLTVLEILKSQEAQP